MEKTKIKKIILLAIVFAAARAVGTLILGAGFMTDVATLVVIAPLLSNILDEEKTEVQ